MGHLIIGGTIATTLVAGVLVLPTQADTPEGGPKSTAWSVAAARRNEQRLTLGGGWNGVKPGQDIRMASKRLGTSTYTNCPPVRVMYTETDWPYIVATHGPTIDIIGVFDNSESIPDYWNGSDTLRGPGGIRTGKPTRRYHRLTSGRRVVESNPGSVKLLRDPYWILRAKHGWYFWVRSSINTRKVMSYGLARTRAIAEDRATTQGGCY